MVYRCAKNRDANSKDVMGSSMIKDSGGRSVRKRNEILKVWERYFNNLLNIKKELNVTLNILSSVCNNDGTEEITYEEINKKSLVKMKKKDQV